MEHGRVEGDGVGQVLGADHLGDESMPGRRVEGVGDPKAEGEDDDVPGLDDVEEGQGGQDECQDHHGRLGQNEEGPARHPVGHDSAIDHEQPGGDAGREPDIAQIGGRTGQVEDEIAQGRGLHPGPEKRNGLPDEPQAVVPVTEGGKGPAEIEVAKNTERICHKSLFIHE